MQTVIRTIALLAATLLAGASDAATFPVTNIDDTGPGSLRDAIAQANATLGADQIVFAIPGAGPHVIKPLTELPPLTEAVDIDGSSQDDIVLDGAELGMPDGPVPFIAILSDGNTVKGLEIRNFFQFGIAIVGNEVSASNNIIEDNHIHSIINQGTGVAIISFGTGKLLSGNIIKGNEIENNSETGVLIQVADGSTASGNIIEDNHIHGNTLGGVAILSSDLGGSLASGNIIEDNHIHNNGGVGLNPVGGGIALIVLDLEVNEINATLSGNTFRGNNIHNNTPQGIVLAAQGGEEEAAILSNNAFTNNTIEANTGWGVDILVWGDGTVVDNIFTNNAFVGNGLGQINGRVNITAVQPRTWGEIKAGSK